MALATAVSAIVTAIASWQPQEKRKQWQISRLFACSLAALLWHCRRGERKLVASKMLYLVTTVMTNSKLETRGKIQRINEKMDIAFCNFPRLHFYFLATDSKFLLLVFWVLTFYVCTPGTLNLQANSACKLVRTLFFYRLCASSDSHS